VLTQSRGSNKFIKEGKRINKERRKNLEVSVNNHSEPEKSSGQPSETWNCTREEKLEPEKAY